MLTLWIYAVVAPPLLALTYRNLREATWRQRWARLAALAAGVAIGIIIVLVMPSASQLHGVSLW